KKVPMTTLDENVNRVPRVCTNERVEEGEFLLFLNAVSETSDSLLIFNFDRSKQSEYHL
ncbi:hypothetical protein WN51_11206, partial [Melipona quadrifasciata]